MNKRKSQKSVPPTVIKPARTSMGTVAIETLAIGEKFLYGDNLYMLTDTDPEAIDLLSGESRTFDDYGAQVVPVNLVINWTKK